MSSSSQDDKRILPPLMDFPVRPFPSFIHSVRNWFFTNFLIRPYFDAHFSKTSFIDGAQVAVEFISNCLAEGDFEALEQSNAVSSECLKELRRNISLLSMTDRKRLAVGKEDIVLNFIYQIGIMLDDDTDDGRPTRRHVEITYSAHYIQDLGNMESWEARNISHIHQDVMKDIEAGRQLIVNYRFIREYTKGVEDSWTVNALNHATLKDVANEYD